MAYSSRDGLAESNRTDPIEEPAGLRILARFFARYHLKAGRFHNSHPEVATAEHGTTKFLKKV